MLFLFCGLWGIEMGYHSTFWGFFFRCRSFFMILRSLLLGRDVAPFIGPRLHSKELALAFRWRCRDAFSFAVIPYCMNPNE